MPNGAEAPPPPGLHDFVLRMLVAIGLIALALFLWQAADVLLLVFGAGLLAIVLHAGAQAIHARTGLREGVALAVVVLGALLGLGAAFWLFGAELAAQAEELATRLPEAWTTVQKWLQQHGMGRALLQRLEGSASELGSVAAKVTQWMTMASAALLELALVVFGAVYLAADPGRYRSGFLKLFPPGARRQVGDTVDVALQALRRWVLAQLVIMVLVGSLTGLGLWLVGMPAPLALAVLSGLLEFVPFIGPIVAAVPGLLLASTVGPMVPLYALAVYLVVQQVEGNLVTPMVAGRMLALPPALVLFSILALGTVLGPLGWIFAVPLTVLLVVVIGRLYVREALHTPVNVPGEGPAQG